MTSTFPRREGDPVGPFLADLVAAQRAAGLDVRVVAPHDAGLPRRQDLAGVTVRRFRYGPAGAERLAYRGGLLAATGSVAGAAMVPAYLGAMAAATLAEARAWRPDVIHAHWWLPAGLAAVTVGPLVRVPVVVTLHGSDVGLAGRTGPAGRLARAGLRMVVRRSAAVAAVSPALAVEAETAAGLAPGTVTVAVMPVEVDGAGAPPPPDRPGRPVRLAAVGRLTPEKGFDVLLDGLIRWAGSRPVPAGGEAGAADTAGTAGTAPGPGGIELDLVGDGPGWDELVARARRGGLRVEEREGHPGPVAADGAVPTVLVRMRGALPRPAVHALLGEVDAVAVPSRREGLGLVAVEAVLLGRPVIASAVGGLPGVLGAPAGGPGPVDGGELVAPGDVDGWAAALERVGGLAPPGPLARRAAAAHRPEVVAVAHQRLYARVCNRS